MQQCYQSALSAKSLAHSLKRGAASNLTLALSQTIDMDLLVGPLAELQRAFPDLQLSIWRADAAGVAERLKKGEADLAVAGPLSRDWERFDAWPLFRDPLAMVVHRSHPLAGRNTVEVSDIEDIPVLLNPVCESAEDTSQQLGRLEVEIGRGHQIGSQHDLIMLVEANLGIGFLPRSASARHGALRQIPIAGLDVSREVSLYSVAGRQRSAAADALIKLLRTRDWAHALH
jgi:DNA-binding transcriptional LysR family regulator